jgi:hypothetical protein
MIMVKTEAGERKRKGDNSETREWKRKSDLGFLK